MTRFTHIYFSKKGGKSVYKAVKDIGKRGVRTSKEVGAIAIAQFLDWLDGWTYNKEGKRIKFSDRTWAGRLKILRILARRYGGIRIVNFIQKLKKAVENKMISKKKAREIVIKLAKTKGLPITRFRLP